VQGGSVLDWRLDFSEFLGRSGPRLFCHILLILSFVSVDKELTLAQRDSEHK
jgi:hypothetical protein